MQTVMLKSVFSNIFLLILKQTLKFAAEISESVLVCPCPVHDMNVPRDHLFNAMFSRFYFECCEITDPPQLEPLLSSSSASCLEMLQPFVSF